MVDEKTLWLIGNDLVNELVKVCPVDKGRLKDSIKFRRDGDSSIIISMADYGRNVEWGTPPHIIRPKYKKSLKFKDKSGGDVFAKSVNHPGTDPQPFIRRTIKTQLPGIIRMHMAG